jgi:hypothetical protein
MYGDRRLHAETLCLSHTVPLPRCNHSNSADYYYNSTPGHVGELGASDVSPVEETLWPRCNRTAGLHLLLKNSCSNSSAPWGDPIP